MSRLSTRNETSLAMVLAPEDILPGEFVAPLNEIHEYPSFLWDQDESGSSLVRVQLRADKAGKPRKVIAVCLPFVFLKTAKGRHLTVDVRQCQLVRLSRDYARRVWKISRKKKKRKTGNR